MSVVTENNTPPDAGAGRRPEHLERGLGLLDATMIVVGSMIGSGIFITSAESTRLVGSPGWLLAAWALAGLLTITGALCCAELAAMMPRAGGQYVFLREAYGPRIAFIYGWMALLVVDPGLAAALSIGLAQYLLAALGANPAATAPVAFACLIAFGALTLAGFRVSASVIRWTAVAKLAIVGLLVLVAVTRTDAGSGAAFATGTGSAPSLGALAGAVIAAFFGFGGWWELGRMSGEVDDPARTMPRALLGGVVLVTVIYALVSVAFVLAVREPVGGSDEAFVAAIGAALFGDRAGRLLAAGVVIAVVGSLAAVMFGAPRVYVAMARDGLFPQALARVHGERGTSPGGTLIQVGLASVLVALGTFEQILGYFVPAAVLFLGMSAAAVLILPRPAPDAPVFRTPGHPLPIVLFLLLITTVLILFAAGQPRSTLIGFVVVALGLPVSYLVIRTRRR